MSVVVVVVVVEVADSP